MTRRLLCVNQDPFERNTIANALSDMFEVHEHSDLDDKVLHLFREHEQKGQTFDALVTQFPYNRPVDLSDLCIRSSSRIISFYACYSKSMSALSDIRWNYPDAFILVYSGAASTESDKSIILGFGGADAVIEKGNNFGSEIDQIRTSLNEFYSKPPRRWKEVVDAERKPPQFSLSEGYTTVTAVINRYFAFQTLRAIQEIATTSNNYSLEVSLKKESSTASGKKFMEIMMLRGLRIGEAIEISVEGTDETAKETAAMLYCIITSRENRQ